MQSCGSWSWRCWPALRSPAVRRNQKLPPIWLCATRVVDAGGRLLLPGFIDSHFHVSLGNDPNVVRITGNSPKEILAQVKAFSEKRPDLNWIEMDGWNYSAFPNGILPFASDLDGLTGGRPAFLVAYDYHT